MGTGAFEALDFGTLNLPHISPANVHHRFFEVEIHPHQSEQFRHPQGRGSVAQGERSPRLRNVEKNLERLLESLQSRVLAETRSPMPSFLSVGVNESAIA
jgi:hypothetical protein